jgi:hypothetical protein
MAGLACPASCATSRHLDSDRLRIANVRMPRAVQRDSGQDQLRQERLPDLRSVIRREQRSAATLPQPALAGLPIVKAVDTEQNADRSKCTVPEYSIAFFGSHYP